MPKEVGLVVACCWEGELICIDGGEFEDDIVGEEGRAKGEVDGADADRKYAVDEVGLVWLVKLFKYALLGTELEKEDIEGSAKSAPNVCATPECESVLLDTL